MATTKKGFINDWAGNTLLPITRGELVLDELGNIALASDLFLAGTHTDVSGKKLPGLITAAERELLSRIGGDGDLSLTDVYTKLGYINSGLKVNNTLLSFYKNNTSTPITITTTKDKLPDNTEVPTLDLKVEQDQTVKIGLNTLNAVGLSASGILRSITVDKYGRVTAVSGSDLTNEDIPQILTEKILSGATTSVKAIANNDLAVVNKAYVDDKFDTVNSIATGALVFGGTLSTSTSAAGVLSKNNYYYKVIDSFTIGKENIYTGDNSITAGMDITVRTGDTLIVKDGKFVYIPSGDEKETFITVGKKNDTSILNKAQGEVTFTFDGPFTITQGSGNIADISIPKASDNTNGYLSKEDYAKFNSYASQAATTYTEEVSSDDKGSYKIGTLTVANYPYDIYGINNTYSLSLVTGTYNQINCPALKFTEDGTSSFYNIYGYNGIKTEIDGTTLKLSSTNEVLTLSRPYLTITDNYQFKVNIGSYNEETEVITGGLTDYNEFHNFRVKVAEHTNIFTVINNSLNETTAEYHYGSDTLVEAITVTI